MSNKFHNNMYTITENIIDNDEVPPPVMDAPYSNQTLKFRLKDDDGEITFS